MDANTAKKIIRETFQNSFDRSQFIRFTKELFNKFEEATFVYRGNTIPQAYQPFIHTLERVGKYMDAEDNKIDILIVRLKKEKSIERARTMQRNFIAWYLNGSRGGELKDAAIVAFYMDESEDWRFSLIKMDYQLDKDAKGKSKITKELTPAKRFSFLVGKHENSHTAQKQLLPILEDDEHGPLLSGLEQAFNIEIVTKEFFTKYRELFLEVKEALDKSVEADLKIKQEFSQKAIDTGDFAKKLLGQIVFLYFLQKKGWFGVERQQEWGSGPKNFLRRLYEKRYCEYKNFFNEVLEPLFYNALAVERPHDWSDRFNCKIPFLNGGLFDPLRNYDWVHTDIELPNELFHNEFKTKEGDTGTGILDIFDRYNFTVKEDEPLEKEVAVDPEMLGKVFENLLEVKDRKSKGTYYTPREIVHYMCQQSLINYLATEFISRIPKEEIEDLVKYGDSVVENEAQVERLGKETETYYRRLSDNIYQNAAAIDDKLANIKVCDPAIGSGAFPVGMMSEIVKARNVLSNYLPAARAYQETAFKQSRTIYSFKRDCIQNSLYGVDIDPGAVEIAKLRLWLSLIVDEEDIKEIKPLPNLDYKIMQGNSLLEEFEGIKLFDEKLLESPIIDSRIFESDNQKIIALQSKLLKFYMPHPEWMQKKDTPRPIEVTELENQLRALLKQKKRLPNNSTEQKDLFASVGESKQIRDELENLHKKFFEETNKRVKEEMKRKIENLEWDLIEATLEEHKKVTELKKLREFKKSNIKPFFLWKLHFAEVFQQGGFNIIIANPPYVSVKEISIQDKKTFNKIFETGQGRFNLFTLFLEKGDKILRNNGVLTFILPEGLYSNIEYKYIRKYILDNSSINFINLFSNRVFEAAVDTSIISTVKKVNKNNDFPIIRDLTVTPTRLFQEDFKKLPGFLYAVNLDINSGDIVHKVLENSKETIENILEIQQGIIYSGQPKEKVFANQILNDKYKKILDGRDILKWKINWENKLENRFICYTNKLHRPREERLFLAGEKILLPRRSTVISCALDNEQYYCLNTAYVCLLKNNAYSTKFILGVLNSKLINYFYSKLFFGWQVTIPALNSISVPNIEELPIKIENLVQRILSVTSSSDYLEDRIKQTKVCDLEYQIDKLVYELYGLSSEEIKTVETK